MQYTRIPLITMALGLALSLPARADDEGACHFHGRTPASESTVVGCAEDRKDELVSEGKLDKSWNAVKKPDTAAIVQGKKAREWRVVYKNPAVKDAAKATLYLFFTPQGNFVAANFTGE